MQGQIIVAGLGCRRHCSAADIVAVVRAAEHAACCTVHALAAPAFKHGEPGLREAARQLGLPLHFVDDAALARAQPHCPTRSAAALRATGHASIAEAAALATTGGSLLLPRLAHGAATCSLSLGGFLGGSLKERVGVRVPAARRNQPAENDP